MIRIYLVILYTPRETTDDMPQRAESTCCTCLGSNATNFRNILPAVPISMDYLMQQARIQNLFFSQLKQKQNYFIGVNYYYYWCIKYFIGTLAVIPIVLISESDSRIIQ